MSSELTNITPHPKSEAWKFTPKNLLSQKNFVQPTHTTLDEALDTKVAIGPSSHQFEALSLLDLQGDGYIKVSQSTPAFLTDSNTKRASLDYTLADLYKKAPTLKVDLLKPLASTLWISPSNTLRVAEINLAENSSQTICIFEADSLKADAEGFSFNFNVSKGATLELGVSANTSNSTFSVININTEGQSKANVFSLLSGDVDYKRIEVNIYQKGVESEASLNGLCFTNNTSSLELHSNVFHLNSDQHTTQIYKTICSGKGKAIFGGRIHLTEQASGATVEQLNNNLLIGKKASVDTQPELNIYQDNVKASHGATTSTVDDDHLFYFASRGFKPEQSKRMLLEAFCKSSFSNINNKGLIDYFSDALLKELQNVE